MSGFGKNYTTDRAPRRHVYQDHTQYTSNVSGYGKIYHWQGSKTTCVPRLYIIYVKCVWLWQKIPLAGLQDHRCTKTIHSMCQVCLALAKYTTDRAPRPHMYQDHTQYTSAVSGCGKIDHWQGSKTTHVPRPYPIYVSCVWLWHNRPLAGLQDHSRPEKEKEKSRIFLPVLWR